MIDYNPIVSVCCITYNHEKFIGEAIEGFLMQKTSFPIEILINDDASTDGTVDVIIEYEKNHPGLIFPIYQKENQYSKGVRPINKFNFERARGKYIAICEGDDYWTDPLKLQKQVDFLEGNPEYGLVYTNFKIQEQNRSNESRIACQRCYSGNVVNELIKFNFIATLTVCFKRKILDNIDFENIRKQNFKMGDYPIWLEFSRMTKIQYINEVTATYRILIESTMHSKSFEKREAFILSNLSVQQYYLKKFNITSTNEIEIIRNNYNSLLMESINHCNYNKAKIYARKLFSIQKQNHQKNNIKFLLKLICTKNKILFYLHFRLIKLINKIVTH